MKTNFYKYNKNSLQFEEVKWIKSALKSLSVVVVLFFIVITNLGLSDKTPITQLTEEQVIIINRNHDNFTPEKLETEINRMNFRFPHIVYAQSMLETGSWTAPIYIENHNLFGMKEAKVRPTTARGTKRNHAYYDNWKESVLDYTLYYASYLRNLQTEEEYFEYLDASYAEDTDYVSILKKIIEENNLKEKFNI